MMDKLEIRGAVPEDKKAVLRFCQQTWDWGDYIPHVWDAWFNDPSGRLIVGILGDLPVAVVHLKTLAPGEVWLDGLRVAPEWRRRGTAEAIARYCIGMALDTGAFVVRFMTLASNTSASKIGTKLGFRKVACFLSCWANGEEGIFTRLTVLKPECIEALWVPIERSGLYRTVSGLYSTDWTYHKLTKEKLRIHLEMGEVLALDEKEPLSALAIVSTSSLDQRKVIGYVDGKPQALGTLALALKRWVPKTTHCQIDVRLPDLPWVRSAFLQAGYVPYYDEPFLIFELVLSGEFARHTYQGC